MFHMCALDQLILIHRLAGGRASYEARTCMYQTFIGYVLRLTPYAARPTVCGC